LANGTALQAMNEFSPKRPALFFDFVLPPGPKHLFPNLWIADPHDAAPTLSMAVCKSHPRNFEPGLSKLQSGDHWVSYEEPRTRAAQSSSASGELPSANQDFGRHPPVEHLTFSLGINWRKTQDLVVEIRRSL